ncbi:MAG: divalent-cation tolerance protein CutA [Bdellovibrionales bacterium]|nr:divalent-cation tolerance protein CutA [Bdellovibrionales bacterium]
MKSKDFVLAYCTFPNDDVATRTSEQLVAEGLVACANIFPAHKAVYRWQNQLQHESEVAVVMKTAASKKAALKERILAIHPYQTPALVFVKIDDGLPGFLQWIYTQSF